MKEYTDNGILYTWELAGPDGASFTLFPDDDHTKEQAKEAKAWLRNTRDVVHLSIADDNDRDYLYKSEYFRDPRCRPLRWYQIEQDDKLIRKERKAGTTPTQFVDRFVVPFVKETEEKHYKLYGDKMYNR